MAGGLAAQIPATASFTEAFTFVSGDNGQGSYLGDFTGANNLAKTGEATVTTQFQVWCVDPNQFVNDNETLSADVTPLVSADFSGTYAWTNLNDHSNSGDQTLYREAAYIAQSLTTAETTLVQDEQQCAIWIVMGYSSSSCTYFGNSFYSGAVKSAVDGDVTGAQTSLNYNSIVLADWGIITPTEPDGEGKCNSSNGCEAQEFLYHVVPSGPPSQVTPEPGTMSLIALGLVGMGASGLRRRKRRTV
jgi:hypothetical protein